MPVSTLVDGLGVGDIGNVSLKMTQLSQDGVVVIVFTLR